MLDPAHVLGLPVLALVPGQGIRLGLPNLPLVCSVTWLLVLLWARRRHVAAAQNPTQARRASLLWQLPATVLHETAHWLAAWLLLARPSQISVWPSSRRAGPPRIAEQLMPQARAAAKGASGEARDADDSGQAGHVKFEASAWTAGLVALAPLWLLLPPCLLVWLGLWVPQSAGSAPACAALGLVLAVCGQACWPSAQDWALAARYPGGTAALALAAWVAIGTLA